MEGLKNHGKTGGNPVALLPYFVMRLLEQKLV